MASYCLDQLDWSITLRVMQRGDNECNYVSLCFTLSASLQDWFRQAVVLSVGGDAEVANLLT